MIARVWRGWTQRQDSAPFEDLLRTVIFPSIAARGIRGYRGIDLWRREQSQEVTFVTVMYFDSLEAIRDFAGDDYEQAYVLPQVRQLLSRFDERCHHFEVTETIRATGIEAGTSAAG